MMLFELCGLPGSGKSFLARRLQKDCKVGIKSKSKFKNLIIEFLKKITIYLPSSILLKKKLKQCIMGNKTKGKYLSKTLDFYIEQIVLIAFGYRYLSLYSRGNRLIDEGLVHRIATLVVNYSLSEYEVKKIIEYLTEILQKTNVFYLDVSKEICYESILKRQRHECEMDELTAENLKDFLIDYSKTFDCISKYCKLTKITRLNYKNLEELLK